MTKPERLESRRQHFDRLAISRRKGRVAPITEELRGDEMNDLKKDVSAVKTDAQLILERLTAVENALQAAIEADRQQLDVFAQKHESRMDRLLTDVAWLKSQWAKFSHGAK